MFADVISVLGIRLECDLGATSRAFLARRIENGGKLAGDELTGRERIIATYDVEPEDLDAIIRLAKSRLLLCVELLSLVYKMTLVSYRPYSNVALLDGAPKRLTDELSTRPATHRKRRHQTDDLLRILVDLLPGDL